MNSYSSGIARSDEQIAQLLSERPDGWEYLLYSGALCAGVERLETKYSDYSLSYAPRLGVMIRPDEFIHFVDSQLGELQVIIGTLNKLFYPQVMEDILGPPGISGDPDKILHGASRVVRLYEDMLMWAERVRGMAMPSEYREVIEILVQFAKQPIDELRDFVQRFGEKINELPSLIARGEPVVIADTVKFTIPHDLVESFGAKLAELKQRARL